MKKIVCFLLLLYPVLAVALIEQSPPSSIKKMRTYSEYGGGDVLVQLVKNGSQCSNGYWIKKSDPGFQANYDMLMMAVQLELDSIIIEAHSMRLWSGSVLNTYCHVANVQLTFPQ